MVDLTKYGNDRDGGKRSCPDPPENSDSRVDIVWSGVFAAFGMYEGKFLLFAVIAAWTGKRDIKDLCYCGLWPARVARPMKRGI